MTKTDQEQIVELAKAIGLKVRANSDGSVSYGAVKTFDPDRAFADIQSLRK